MSKGVKPFAAFLALILVLAAGFMGGCVDDTTEKTVASVNGEEIYESEVEEFLKLIYLFMPDTEEVYRQEDHREALKSEVLWFLVENKLLRNEIKELDLETDEARIEEHFNQVREELVSSVYGTEEAYRERLEELNLQEEYLRILHEDTHFREVLYEHVSGSVSEEEAREFVEQNPSFVKDPEQVHAYHILLESEEEALEVLELLEGGADFVELGEERSLDEYVDLGLISSDDMLHPKFLEAAFELEPGEISEPVETTFGFHIIKVTEKEEAKSLSFEEVKEDAMEAQGRMLFEEYINELIAEADVEIYD